MTHPMVIQLRFSRSEFQRGLTGLKDDEARRRFEPMNSISWMIGHLANQENFYWVRMAQGEKMRPELRDLVGTGMPASTPPLAEMWSAWKEITEAADPYLDTLTSEQMASHFELRGRQIGESIGTLLHRNIHHYWYHLGEAMAVRQLIGGQELPEFVGNMNEAVYQPEAAD